MTAGAHPRLVSSAIRTASPASTVPISQRWTRSQIGRWPMNTAIEPAASAIIALTDTLITVCTDPLSVIDIPNLIRETGDKVEITERAETRIVFLIEKAG